MQNNEDVTEKMIGKTLGKYQIIDSLGHGGMADVYKAYQPNLDRHVAIKLIKTTIAEDPEYLARFEREAKSAAALRHPNIVQIYDFDVDAESGQPYIVMELVEGGTLADELEKRETTGTPLPLAETARIIGQVCAALAYAHQRGVIHRDIKPSNIMRDVSGRMILADFGLAKIATGPKVTTTGVTVGTPDYMAPEQAMGESVDARADLYALGAILFELLTGQAPYQGETAAAVMLKHIIDPVPDPRTLRPNLPESLARVAMKSLGKSPGERFQTADEFLSALQAALTTATAPSPPMPSVSPAAAVAAPGPEPSQPVAAPAPPSKAVSYVVTLEIQPPPEPSIPPKVIDFVGRKTELADFTNELATKHLAVIAGMPGVGKTALASELTRRLERPPRAFWHSFHEGEGVNVLIWKLAGFLAWHDQRDLWNTLQGATRAGGQAPPSEVLLDYLFQMVRGQNYLLCFDDFHFVDNDPLLGQFVERLQPALAAGEVDVTMATQRRPPFVPESDLRLLKGLTPADTRALLLQRGLDLPDRAVADLHSHTEGNAELMILAIDVLRRAKDPARLINRLSESEQVERFLVKRVDEGLTDEERSVMSAIAVLSGYPGTRDAIAAVLDGASVRRPLNDLTSRSLLTATEEEGSKEYSLNRMVQEYYYDLLSQRERQAMHRRAAEFYEGEAPNALRAALHFLRCGEHTCALRLITADVWAIINQGQAQTLCQALEQFTERQLADKSDWAKILLARGQVSTLMGETEAARASYESALAQVECLADVQGKRELEARACRGLGELLQDDAPQQALEWLRRGLEAAKGTRSMEEAALRIRTGRLLVYLGDHDAALAALQQGLELLPPGPSRLHITALGNLGNIYCIRGDIQQGQTFLQRVLEHAKRLNDYWAMVEVWIDLGIELDIAGRWAEALAQYHQALEQAERLGSLDQQIRSLLGLGNTHYKQGDYESAKSNLSKCVSLARSQDRKALIIYAGNSLAGVHLGLSEIEVAETWLAEAEQLAQAIGVRDQLPETYRYWALVRLAQGRPTDALTFAAQSVSLAREIRSTSDEGIGLRVLGQAQWATDQPEAALASFDKSLQILADRDPYEAARTQVEWSKCLQSKGDTAKSTALSQAAWSAFKKLGARRELADAENLLTQSPHLL